MPFVSQQQRKWAYSQDPELAKEFEKETPKGKKLPKRAPKRSQKEEIEGSLSNMYAVQKPFSGCAIGKLVHQFDPLSGIPMDQIPHDQVHGVFSDKDQADSVAQQLYQEYEQKQMELEAKKEKVTEKLKRVMTKMEKARNESMKMIKENPKEAAQHRDSVARYTEKIDLLMNKLEMIEKSKKLMEKVKADNKKSISEAIAVPKGKGKVVVYRGNGAEGKGKNVLAIRFDISSNPQNLTARVADILDFLRALPGSTPGGDGDEVGYIDLAIPFTTSDDDKQLALQIKNSKSLEDAAK